MSRVSTEVASFDRYLVGHEPVQNTLLVVASARLPDCLVQAIERQFGWIDVIQVPTMMAACSVAPRPVALILFDRCVLDELARDAARIRDAHAGAVFALLQNESSRPLSITAVLAIPQMRGVLPMNLKLDLLLSVLQILLQGGFYIPLPMIAASVGDAMEVIPRENRRRPQGGPAGKGIGGLTDREFEILELVTRGLQNKLIAGRLGLSENTIKIHLHNILTKLGVHNRTEAACRFRDHQALDPKPTFHRPSALQP